MGSDCEGDVSGGRVGVAEWEFRAGQHNPGHVFCVNGSVAATSDVELGVVLMRLVLGAAGFAVRPRDGGGVDG